MATNRGLLIDKYRPKSLAELDFNHEANQFLTVMATHKDMPHLILEGPRGSGKKLRAHLYLKQRYGEFTTNSRILNLEIPGKGEVRELHVLYSKYHHQVNPSIHNIYDRSLMQCITSEIIHTKLLFDIPYRTIIIEDADLLSTEAQESLRRTLETCINTCRFIFLANNEDRLIAPIYSRCVTIRVPAPSLDECVSVMTNICQKEGANIEAGTLYDIAQSQSRNLQISINTLNRLLVGGSPYTYSRNDYDYVYSYCCGIVDNIIKGSSIVNTMDKEVRGLIYELVNYCVDCRALIPMLLEIALRKMPESAYEARHELTRIATERDLTIRSSSKDIYHIESFCLYILRIVKTLMLTKQRQVPKIVVRAT